MLDIYSTPIEKYPTYAEYHEVVVTEMFTFTFESKGDIPFSYSPQPISLFVPVFPGSLSPSCSIIKLK